MYYNFSQLRLGDPKGLPSFFALIRLPGGAGRPPKRAGPASESTSVPVFVFWTSLFNRPEI
jgi:hypothetical protein